MGEPELTRARRGSFGKRWADEEHERRRMAGRMAMWSRIRVCFSMETGEEVVLMKDEEDT
jgi:hypothetical protein